MRQTCRSLPIFIFCIRPLKFPNSLEPDYADEFGERAQVAVPILGRAGRLQMGIDRLNCARGCEQSRDWIDGDLVAEFLKLRAVEDGRTSALDHVREQWGIEGPADALHLLDTLWRFNEHYVGPRL